MQLAGTQYATSLDLLRLFAYGTLKDYKSKIHPSALCAYMIHGRLDWCNTFSVCTGLSCLCFVGSLPDLACVKYTYEFSHLL